MVTDEYSLFDVMAGEEARDVGKEQAALVRQQMLAEARSIAISIASSRRSRLVTIDDVQRELLRRGNYTTEDLGNAAGSVFRGSAWKFTGRWYKSMRITNHARHVRIWQLL
jgi:D-serine deaminase-like pyridoxal phosphate-dependent protein